jgi:flagellar export protein FliJ
MNQSVQARPCWSLLAQRAEDQLELIRLEMTQANHRLNQLEHSRKRLHVMYEEYSQQFNQPGSQSRGMSRAVVLRQYMSQMLGLIERVNTDMAYTQNLLAALKEKMIEAEKERIKMQTLAEKNALELRVQSQRAEQRRMDELGTLQFNRQMAS